MKGKKMFYTAAVAFCSFFGVLWGSMRLLRTSTDIVALNGLPMEMDGLRILHISDLHCDDPENTARFVFQDAQSGSLKWGTIWEAVREIDFDIIAITGDIVDKSSYQIEPHLPYIRALAQEYPVFFCEGNHDHYQMKRLRRYLEECGVTVLVNEKAKIEVNGVNIEVIGLQDWYTDNYTVSAGLIDNKAGKDDALRLVLAHQPQHVDSAGLDKSEKSDGTPSLWLSGHTHAGQLRIPFAPVIYAPGQGFFPKYGVGVYALSDDESAKLFVSKGVGATSKTPVRMFNRPEINVIKLTALQGGEK